MMLYIENGAGRTKIGYRYLHGTNSDAGGRTVGIAKGSRELKELILQVDVDVTLGDKQLNRNIINSYNALNQFIILIDFLKNKWYNLIGLRIISHCKDICKKGGNYVGSCCTK